MDKLFETITKFVNIIAQFLKDLFQWKKDDFEPASETLSQYLAEKE